MDASSLLIPMEDWIILSAEKFSTMLTLTDPNLLLDICHNRIDFILLIRNSTLLGNYYSLFLKENSYEVLNSVTEYQTAIANKNFQKAQQLESSIPIKYHDKLAKFLDQIDMKEEAFRLAQDPDHK